MERETIDLYDLQNYLRDSIEDAFPAVLWVKAEISQLKARVGSHCYMELCQSRDGVLVAKARAVIWASRYRLLESYFRDVAGIPLQEGLQVLLAVQVSFSEIYGLTLVVEDIDPEFTVGGKQLRRDKDIERLRKEGYMDMQKEFQLPRLPRRIAVVSSETAAGYRDFRRHLESNEFGFRYSVDLFPALVQGNDAPSSIIAALDSIPAEGYDLVMVMRGGGGKLDMDCFDDYALAVRIATMHLPVLTGIGHDQDFHIADMVANTFVKTPTALADWLIDAFQREDEALSLYSNRLRLAFNNKISAMEARLQLLHSRILAADPRNILKRGYTLTLDRCGKVSRKAASFSPSDTLTVLFPDGKVSCTVNSVEDGTI